MCLAAGSVLLTTPATALPVQLPADTLDAASLAREISKSIGSELGAKVTCQPNVELRAGAKSTCTVTIGSQKLIYNIVQEDDSGNVSFTRTKAILDLRLTQKVIATQLADQIGGSWRVKCAPAGSARFYVVKVKGKFDCGVSGRSQEGEKQSGTVRITVKDLEGNITWKVR